MNYADLITLTGMIIVVYSLFTYYQTNNFIYIITALIGFSCDYFDGYIARKYNISSDFGNILDKLVDKINQVGILLLLIFKFNISPIYLLLYIIREVIIFIMRKNNMKSISSSFHGKLKTALFPLLLLLFHYNVSIKMEFLQLLTIYNFITLLL
jgi:CDP-diacylglycerol--glycerol-3-phosphate 3-phosphatidyltransferase